MKKNNYYNYLEKVISRQILYRDYKFLLLKIISVLTPVPQETFDLHIFSSLQIPISYLFSFLYYSFFTSFLFKIFYVCIRSNQSYDLCYLIYIVMFSNLIQSAMSIIYIPFYRQSLYTAYFFFSS